MGTEPQLVIQINWLKYQKSCIFKECPKSAKRCKKRQKGPKGANKCKKKFQKVPKRAIISVFPVFLPIFKTSSLPKHKSYQTEVFRGCSSPTTCHMSNVRCQVSGVGCQVSLVMCHVSGVVCLYQTVKARDITFWEYDHFLPSPTCHMSYVMCQVSGVISKKKYMYIYVLPNSRFSRIWTVLNLLSCLVVCQDAQIIQKRTNRSQSRPDHTRVD